MIPLYLDYNATTPVDDRVISVLLPYLGQQFGNEASRTHVFGHSAQVAVDSARKVIAEGLGARDPGTIVFTAGATESNNMVLKGLLAQAGGRSIQIITQKTEHGSVLKTTEYLAGQGVEVTLLDVDEHGLVNPDHMRASLSERTVLVSMMYANNEIGTVQPVQELASIAHERPGVLFHVDAAQAVGRILIQVERDGIDLLSLSGHKFYAPKGVGALYLARRDPQIQLTPLLHGGGQEFGLRSGTLNVPGIVAMAKAMELCCSEMPSEPARQQRMRDEFISSVCSELDQVCLNGHPVQRLCNNINLSVRCVTGTDLVTALPHLAFSTGSACAAMEVKPSHVIMAISSDAKRASESVRLSLGRFTTEEQVRAAAADFVKAVKELRARSLEWEMGGGGECNCFN